MPNPRCRSPAANSLDSRIVGRQVAKPRFLNPVANCLDSKSAGRQVPQPRCLSPAAKSLYSRNAGGQEAKQRCLCPAVNNLYSRIAGCQVSKPRCLSQDANSLYSTTVIAKKTLFGVHAQVPYIKICSKKMVLKGFRKSELFENLESRTDKTTRCVIRSLRGRWLWLGGKRNYSINQFANQSVEFIC